MAAQLGILGQLKQMIAQAGGDNPGGAPRMARGPPRMGAGRPIAAGGPPTPPSGMAPGPGMM